MLTKRENKIAELISWGASDKEVAMELHIALLTARTHRKNILSKIRGHNSADIARFYFQNKCHVSFGFNPRRIVHIAIVLLCLIIFDEFFAHNLMIRSRRIEVKEARALRSSRRIGRKYDYAA